jgi:hypothetical protein
MTVPLLTKRRRLSVLALDQRTTQSQHHANGSSIPTAPIRAAENLTVNIFAPVKMPKTRYAKNFLKSVMFIT